MRCRLVSKAVTRSNAADPRSRNAVAGGKGKGKGKGDGKGKGKGTSRDLMAATRWAVTPPSAPLAPISPPSPPSFFPSSLTFSAEELTTRQSQRQHNMRHLSDDLRRWQGQGWQGQGQVIAAA